MSTFTPPRGGAMPGKSVSYWTATADRLAFDPLRDNTRTNVCVIGAGIAGLSVAYELLRRGESVVVLDDGPVGGGMSGQTSAHLAYQMDDTYTRVVSLHGERGAQLAHESHRFAVDRVGQIAREQNIDCDYQRVDAYLVLAPGMEERVLDDELDAMHRAGISAARKLPALPVAGFKGYACIHLPDHAQFHPLRYLAGLAHAVVKHGGRIFTQTHADTVHGGKNVRVTAGGQTVDADAAVVATNSPINDLLALHTKMAAYMTYVVGLRLPRGTMPHVLIWDTLDPYHYVRLQRMDDGDDLLIVGGNDHRTGQEDATATRFAQLETWARDHCPAAGERLHQWAGQCMISFDGLGFIGRNPHDKNVYVVTGDTGMGLTHGTLAGTLISDLITGIDNEWAGLYAPARKTLKAAPRFIKEAAQTNAPYLDWLTPGEVHAIDEIPPGHGALIREGLTKLAVYRDPHGGTLKLSAVCPHLGGIVHWNDVDKTWDCPCHGSRFDAEGCVVNGPANRGLAHAE